MKKRVQVLWDVRGIWILSIGRAYSTTISHKEGLTQNIFQYWLRKYLRIHESEVPTSRDFLPLLFTSSGTHQHGLFNCEIELCNASPSGMGLMVIRFHSHSISLSLLKLIHSLVKWDVCLWFPKLFYLYNLPTNMCKSFDGLCGIVRGSIESRSHLGNGVFIYQPSTRPHKVSGVESHRLLDSI